MRLVSICATCGHLGRKHRPPFLLFAVLGRWACRHRHPAPYGETVACACTGWKAAN